jgi:hypothetical protein
MPRSSHMMAQTDQPPLMPAHAGIQLSLLGRKRLKKLDSRVRGNERVGRFAFYRVGLEGIGYAPARRIPNLFTGRKPE